MAKKEKGFIKSLYVHTLKYPNPKEHGPLVYYYNWVKKWKEIHDLVTAAQTI